MIEEAYAKINLGLDVLRKREDGYHEVRMIMQTVGISDTLEFQVTDQPGIEIKSDSGEVPCDDSNLIYKAAKLLMDEFDITGGLSVRLEKRIPVAAGMAGGSTDAAATLRAVNKLFSLGLSNEELAKRGKAIGADVPYCVAGGTALCEGIGEILTPIDGMPELHLVVAKPAVSVSTAFVYGNLKASKIKNHPDIDGMARAIEASDVRGIASRLGNVLESVTLPEYPVITRIKQTLKDLGALGVLMSGSGPTVFAIFKDKEKARLAYAGMKEAKLAKDVFLTTSTGERTTDEK
ncbi:MAG: 4-(cytidine 5'-diphospho)-2-C-methyl-D-erythritol kinase [Lachnospiraceae bacterium]|nr:4-(cytidine 5'-diphospho)-2-C-methyl-D-erythritol kinase [Lachnospiraceae bacterium]